MRVQPAVPDEDDAAQTEALTQLLDLHSKRRRVAGVAGSASRAARLASRCSLLSRASGGAILDEVQRVPELLSWIQVAVDEDPTPGRFVLTGSHQLERTAGIAQSLAGRTSLSVLLPFDRSALAPPGDL